MAARRLATSAVDWVAFAERVHPHQLEAFRAFKAKSDAFVAKIHRFPEALPKIDFSFYTSRVSNPAMVAEFEKAYKAVEVPFPKDKDKVREQIDAEEKEQMAISREKIAEAERETEDARLLMQKIKELPPIEQMTQEMHLEYFPDIYYENQFNPTMWPHTKWYQPENDPDTIP